MAEQGSEKSVLSAALRRLDSCVAVGVTERLSDTFGVFAEILGGRAGPAPLANVGRNRPKTIDSAAVAAIRSLTTVDAILHEEAKSRLEDSMARRPGRPHATRPTLSCGSGSRPSVLVVDDEPLAAAMAAETLRDLGCRATSVSDAGSAIDALGLGLGVDILFTDVLMSAMDGFTLAQIAKRQRPDLKVIYATDDGRRAGRLRAAASAVHGPIIEKPYSSVDLDDAIKASWR
jgi:CheY-like chemotaxis protein